MAPKGQPQDPSQRRSRWRRVARAGLVGLATLVLLEAALDVASWRTTVRLDDRPSPNGPGRRVLCVGDSWTFGVGADPGQSYPDFLQKHLGAGYLVINEGRPGINSSQVLERLPSLIQKHHPDYVLVMAGMNNKHNTVGGSYEQLIKAGYINPSRFNQAVENVDHLLWNSAVYRLVRWSLVKPGGKQLEFENLAAHAPIEEKAAPVPVPGQPTAESPWAALDKAHEAEVRGDAPAALAAIREGFSLIKDARTFGEPAMNHLIWAREHASPTEYTEILDRLRANLPAEDFQTQVQDSLLLSENHSIGEKMLWFDLAKMNDLVRQASGQLVLVAYPTGGARETMAAFADVHRLPFVDPARFLARTLLDRSLLASEPRYASQGRLSGHGNDEFAQFVLDRARAQGLFPSEAGLKDTAPGR